MVRILIAGIFCVLTLSVAFSQPNIVLIMADDVGCEPIGIYGGQRWETPHIDSLAREGMRFSHCFSMPVCHPSRICLMTGKYPFRFDTKWGAFPREEEQQSLAAVLKRCGYRTAIAGKWQLCLMKDDRMQPQRMGFDEWCLFGWHEGARFHDPMIYQNGKLRSNTAGEYGPEVYVDFLSDFMQRSKLAGEPFFAYYSMALAHDVTDDLLTQVPYVPGKDRWMNYGEMIQSLDEMVGRVVRKIDELQLRENTIILFTGDNGTAVRSKLRHQENGKYEYEQVYSIQHGKRVRGGKGTLLDIGTNVPLIASWRGKIKQGTQSDALVDFSDWLPTLVEVAGGHEEQERDGRSFASTLFRAGDPASRKYAFAQGRGKRAWVRTQKYKLYNDGKYFDLTIDPFEKEPLTRTNGDAAAKKKFLKNALMRLDLPWNKK
ncbi:sulfatase-like hydrolase/transferase [bacterium]|nr:sulfatase-like hydrolase/transferase [Pseudomonadales bacterium]MDB4639267.1 sulfatase-like hydrolase/transferase [bacterium]MDC0317000.1 sulfatase-like hydrolase/transferase [bacterium]